MTLTCREYGDLRVGTDLTDAQAKRLFALGRRASQKLKRKPPVLTHAHRGLKAGQVVGVLAIPGQTLEILPKIDAKDYNVRAALVHMLAVAHDLKVASGELAALTVQRQNLLELLIALFANRLLEAARRGLPRRYVEHEEELPQLRGRLNIVRQFTRFAGRPDILACRFDELSANTPLNRVLKAAVSRLLRTTRSAANARRLAEAAARFEFVGNSADPLKEAVGLDRTNTEFHDLHHLAQLFLRGDWQTTTTGESTGFSLLFPMNELFENFIGKCLERTLAHRHVGLQTKDRYALKGPFEKGLFNLQPDAVIKNPTLVLDTKWKELAPTNNTLGVSQGDIYQILAYARAYDAQHVILLYPWRKALEVGINRTWTEPSTKRKLHIATVDVGQPHTVQATLREIVSGAECALASVA